MRVISLVPSLTEFLIDIGLEDELIGRTRFCIHPKEKIENIPIIGGTKNPKIEKIKALKPDLVIANKEENRKEDVEQIQTFASVLLTEIDSIVDAFRELKRIGESVGKNLETKQLLESIKLEIPKTNYKPVRTLYFIWKEPWMSVGGQTYIHEIMELFGFQNVCAVRKRYPQLAEQEIRELKPELILLSSEPYPFKENHKKEVQNMNPKTQIELINGEWFSWYGSGMLIAFKSLKSWRNEFDSKAN